MTPETLFLAVKGTGLGLILLLTVPGARAIVARSRLRRSANEYHAIRDIYCDQDGSATEESVDAFSDKTQRWSIAALAVVGFLVSLTTTITLFLTTDPSQHIVGHCLEFAAWVCLSTQSVSLFAEPWPTKRFTLGIYNAMACIVLFTTLILQRIYGFDALEPAPYTSIHHPLLLVQAAVAALSAIISILIPRRPEVFRNGKAVDAQYTTTLLSRISFSWPGPLLEFATKNGRLEITDLPELDFATRSKTLRESFDRTRKPSQRLWKTLVYEYADALILQSVLAVVSATLSFLPQYCLLGILRSLEARSSGSAIGSQGWLWVIALGSSILIYSTIEAWLYWTVYHRLGITVFEQLSAVVFAKSIRRKDIKGSQKSEKEDSKSLDVGEAGKPSSDSEEDDEDGRKTRQATINLVAVDAKRVSDFAAFNYIIITTFVKLTVAFTFLIRLIGWKSLCAGLLVSAVVTPANIFAARRYTSAQTSLMKFRDQKMAVVTEVLQGIRQIKFSALEERWEKKILDLRNTELRAQWTAFVYDIVLLSIWIIGPVMLSAVSLGVYSLLHGDLSASVAFTTMAVFTSIEFSLAILPELIADFAEAYVSAGRIEKHLESPERVQETVRAEAISFEKATLAWPADDSDDDQERFTLQNLNLSFPPKALSVISGRTGSGKSLLLSAVLGEAEILDGIVRVPVPPPLEQRFDDRATKANWIVDSAIAYVAQVPWIENASIKDNILFGLPFDQERYKKVLFACALEKDLEMLPDGELTDIGANGINLSGGQKWRISFARALYSRAGILVMDDLFSALDAHTGRHLHVHALTGELCQGRTRILVTHHVGLCLPATDYFVHLENGVVQHSGPIEELKRTGSLSSILAQDEGDAGEANPTHQPKDVLADDTLDPDEGLTLQRIISHRSQISAHEHVIDPPSDQKQPPKVFQQDEKREIGAVKLSHYLTYVTDGGGWVYWFLVLVCFSGYVVSGVAKSFWVSIWTRGSSTAVSDQHLAALFSVSEKLTALKAEHSVWYYLGVYVLLSVLTCIIGSIRYCLLLTAGLKSSRSLFKKLTFAVLRAPLRWLDTVPVGRILNRFTSDFNMVDSKLPYDFGMMINNGLQVVGIIVAGLLVSPSLIIFSLLLLAVCLYFSRRYLAGAREIKRLESTAKSPVFEQFGSALIGLTTIRAFGKAHTYIDRMHAKIDRHAQAYWYLWLFNRWFGFRMNMVGAIFSTITAALIVSIKGIDASLAGFALSFALQYNTAIAWTLRLYANLELDMNATERVIEYSGIEIEKQGGEDVPAAWPARGLLEVSNLVAGYAPDLPPVLKGLSFTVDPNQRVGVVGRTGAGKSSLTLALFRFLEAREGTIHVDGIDVSKIKLRDLRSRLAIIPQDPVLFSGTIRSNLDPFEEYTDAELRDALERVHLICGSTSSSSGVTTPTAHSGAPSSTTANPSSNANIFSSLNSSIAEGGLNLSQGQRQLLCLARAIVSRPKVIVLDEATSAVDMDTDSLIQRSIRSEFGRNSTLLVIAHRLSTIADFDRILVMDAGKAVEFGSPKGLLQIEGGIFRGLVQESGERDQLESIILGKGVSSE